MANRPQPRFPEPHTEPFWDAAQEGRLTYQTCDDCNEVVFTPRLLCTNCGASSLTRRDSKGEGAIYTFTVVRQNRNPAFAEMGAYVLAWVDLDEGFRMLSNIVGVPNPTTDIEIGQRVSVEFEAQESGSYPIPVFRPI